MKDKILFDAIEEISKRLDKESILPKDIHGWYKGEEFYVDKKGKIHLITEILCSL